MWLENTSVLECLLVTVHKKTLFKCHYPKTCFQMESFHIFFPLKQSGSLTTIGPCALKEVSITSIFTHRFPYKIYCSDPASKPSCFCRQNLLPLNKFSTTLLTTVPVLFLLSQGIRYIYKQLNCSANKLLLIYLGSYLLWIHNVEKSFNSSHTQYTFIFCWAV